MNRIKIAWRRYLKEEAEVLEYLNLKETQLWYGPRSFRGFIEFLTHGYVQTDNQHE